MSDLVQVRDLRVYLDVDAGTVKAVDGVSFRIPVGGTVALVGESGSGKTMVAQAIMSILPRVARIDGQPRALTGFQFTLLVVMAERAGRVLSREALLDLTRGEALEEFDRSIDVHISRLRAALEDDPKKPRRILTLRGAGYVFAKEQDR